MYPWNFSTLAHDEGVESPEIPENGPSSVPLTLAQRALVTQELWAPAYAEAHRFAPDRIGTILDLRVDFWYIAAPCIGYSRSEALLPGREMVALGSSGAGT